MMSVSAPVVMRYAVPSVGACTIATSARPDECPNVMLSGAMLPAVDRPPPPFPARPSSKRPRDAVRMLSGQAHYALHRSTGVPSRAGATLRSPQTRLGGWVFRIPACVAVRLPAHGAACTLPIVFGDRRPVPTDLQQRAATRMR